MKVEIRAARPADAKAIVAVCREFEKTALDKLGPNPERVIVEVIRSSGEAWAGYIDGKIACLWGVERGSLISNSAYVWLTTGRVINEHPFVFVRHSQIRLADLRQRYHYIHGYVQADNEASVRWLKWLGFRLEDAVVVNGYSICKFSMAS